MLVAGEASGDNHTAALVTAMQREASCLSFIGIGGKAMQEVGVKLLFDINRISFMGIFGVLFHFKHLRRAWRVAKEAIVTDRPDLLILVDYGGFNLRLAKLAHQYNIRVLYYILPKVWASRPGRLKIIQQTITKAAVILPFEKTLYQKAGVPVEFVGNPIADYVKPTGSKQLARNRLGLDQEGLYIGLAPGSRHSEVKRFVPVLIKTAKLILKVLPNAKFLVPVARTMDLAALEKTFSAENLPILLNGNNTQTLLESCDVVVGSSGTLTLELAILDVPMVIFYKVASLFYWLGKWFLRAEHIGLSNIIAGYRVCPEFLQSAASPKNLANATIELVCNDKKIQALRAGYALIRQQLDEKNADIKTAKLALEMLDE